VDDAPERERQAEADGEAEQGILDERCATHEAQPCDVCGPGKCRDRRGRTEPGQRQPGRAAGEVHGRATAREEARGGDQQAGTAVELPAGGLDG
jgi:hypothetical protein